MAEQYARGNHDVRCEYCGNFIQGDAETCSYCGRPRRRSPLGKLETFEYERERQRE